MYTGTTLGRLTGLIATAGLMLVAGTATAQTAFEDLKLVPTDGGSFDEFGFSIAVGGGVVAVGARLDDDRGPNSGSVYLFDAVTGVQTHKLHANDGTIDDWFGYSVAIDGDLIIVGAPLNETPFFSGSVYVFDARTGVQLTKLIQDEGEQFDNFGWAVDSDDGTVVVGAFGDSDNGPISGSVYLFDANSGMLLRKIIPVDGAADDRFGLAVAIDNGIVAVGAHLDDDNGESSGSAYLFDAATGNLLFKLLPNDGALSDEFGWSIDISNGIVVVGAYQDNDLGAESGSAYLFDAATGMQIAKLLPNDGIANDWFGYSVGISDNLVAVGMPFDGDGGNSFGSAYLFDATDGSQLLKVSASDAGYMDRFGIAVDIDQGVLAAGSYHDDIWGMWSGSAYVLDRSCQVDFNPDGVLNFFDVSAFLVAFVAHDPIADLTGDGLFNFFDVSAFLLAFNTGCP